MQKTFLGGQLYPAIVRIIAEQRVKKTPLNSLKATDNSPISASLAKTVNAFDEYDAECSIERAVQTLNIAIPTK